MLIKENHVALAGGSGKRSSPAAANPRTCLPKPEGTEDLDQVAEAIEAALTASRWTTWTSNLSSGPDLVNRAVREPNRSLGRMNLETVRAVAETGVDFISIGALTHSAPQLDVCCCWIP